MWKLRFSSFVTWTVTWKFVTWTVVSFGELQFMKISLNFKTSRCNLKIRGLATKLCVAFLLFFNFGRNYDVLRSKSPYILLNKNINFHENETESKMENPIHSFRETHLVLQLTKESQIKSKSVMSWSSRKEKQGVFCSVYFAWSNFFNICVLCQCIVYWLNIQNMYSFTSQKTLFHTLFCLLLKIVESLHSIFKERSSLRQYVKNKPMKDI